MYHVFHLGCGWKGPQVKWPDHLRHDCPEVEGDESESRQRRDGSVPLAIRAARELEEAAEEEAIAEDEARVIQREVPDPNGNNDDEDAQALVLALIDKRTGAICDACQSEIFNEGYMCKFGLPILYLLQKRRRPSFMKQNSD